LQKFAPVKLQTPAIHHRHPARGLTNQRLYVASDGYRNGTRLDVSVKYNVALVDVLQCRYLDVKSVLSAPQVPAHIDFVEYWLQVSKRVEAHAVLIVERLLHQAQNTPLRATYVDAAALIQMGQKHKLVAQILELINEIAH
jgi:hypothetical protein